MKESVKIEREQMRKIRALAKNEGRTLGGMTRILLEKGLVSHLTPAETK